VQSLLPDNADLFTMAADGKGDLSPLLNAPKPINETLARFSPDGRWFAYASNESGRPEVFVQAFPPSGGKWQVSTQGGTVPVWRGDGKELFYQTPGDDSIYAVPVRTQGSSFEAGLPVKLFQRRMVHTNRERNRWVVTRDGQRFLLNVPSEDTSSGSIQVVLDWTNGLQKH
jgi:hypothetical protein